MRKNGYEINKFIQKENKQAYSKPSLVSKFIKWLLIDVLLCFLIIFLSINKLSFPSSQEILQLLLVSLAVNSIWILTALMEGEKWCHSGLVSYIFVMCQTFIGFWVYLRVAVM